MKRLDPFLVSLLCAVVLASVFPCPERLHTWLNGLTTLLITLMFFLQGARIERRVILDNMQDWRLQGSILLASFVLFPLLGLGLHLLCRAVFPHALIGEELWAGILFLCCLPSTVQSSIALTSIARGNVPAAICASTTSNMIGIVLTPLLTGMVLGRSGSGTSWLSSVLDVGRELLLPFLLGQILHRWLGPVVQRHKILISFTDRGSILVMVYAVFSMAVTEGLWNRLPFLSLAEVALLDGALLTLILLITFGIGLLIDQPVKNDIALQFCGSKKSLATGIPMASVIFQGSSASIIVIPLLIYHQIQLFICTLLARMYSKRPH